MAGEYLVRFAQQVAVDAAELSLWHQAHANLVGDDDEVGIELVHGGDKLGYLRHYSFLRFRVVRLITEQVGDEQGEAVYEYHLGIADLSFYFSADAAWYLQRPPVFGT